ncbi:MAG TPA: choice-of-anchor D domain-containing protein [Pyrinomonadaceae bacterium]|nr:choice-of-anchor D domain-containing protein [Pyrinomonadaceae bacterium]
MKTLIIPKALRRNFRALRLVASVISTLIIGGSAFAQTAPILTLNSPVSLFDFGRVNTGTISPTTTITVSNSGTALLTISNVSLAGVNPGDYQLISTTCTGVTLSSKTTCTATIRFAPQAIGTRTARLALTDNAAGSPHLVPLTGVGLNPSIPNRQVGPIDPRHGFPMWYQDDQGLRLALCLDTNGLCLAEIPNPSLPPSVTDSLLNFPGEAFWWSAEAEIDRNIGGKVRLVLAKEAAFTTEDATIGNQISFSRIRIRIDNLTPGASYTITHPYGSVTLVADGDGDVAFNGAVADGPTILASGSGSGGGGGGTPDGEIDTTEDIGIGPSDFRAALNGKFSTYLRWDPAVSPAAPNGYIGDPNVTHTVIGSPFNTNFFRVDGPNVGGSGINSIQTTLFSVQGKLAPQTRFVKGDLMTAEETFDGGTMTVDQQP